MPISGQNPGAGDDDVARNAPIVFTLDMAFDGGGIPVSARIYVECDSPPSIVNGNEYWRSTGGAEGPRNGWSGSRTLSEFTMIPDADWQNFGLVYVTAVWTDAGLVSRSETYHFWTVDDSDPVVIQGFPEWGSSNLLADVETTPFSVTLKDGDVAGAGPIGGGEGSGINISSVDVWIAIDGGSELQICSGGVFITGYLAEGSNISGGSNVSALEAPRTYSGQLNRVVTFYGGPWVAGEYTVRVECYDLNPTMTGANFVSQSFSFSIEGPYVPPPDPVPTAFETAAANRDQAWSVLLTIEGIGQAEGIWKFCSEVPDYALADPTYKGWLVDWPSIMSEKVDPLGGLPEAGELVAQIQDHEDALTAKLRIDRASTTKLSASADRTATLLTVDDASGLAVGDVIFVGNEAMLIIEIDFGTDVLCYRAQLDTDAQGHEAGARVFLSAPYVRSRRMRLYLAPTDGDVDHEVEMGVWHEDGMRLSDDFNDYVFSARSQLKYLARVICGQMARWTFHSFAYLTVLTSNISGGHARSGTDLLALWPDRRPYILIGDEVMRLAATTQWNIDSRGELGTEKADHKQGEAIYHVLTGDPIYGSFRWSPGPTPSEDRATGTWIVAASGAPGAHWVDIILCLLTSSARLDDGLELTNYNADYGNWSSLPPGFGMGVPHELINWTSFLNVKARTPGFTFPAIVVGGPPVPFGEWVSKNFLKPLGAFITMASNLIELVMPRLPLAGEELTIWDVDVMHGLEEPPSQLSSEVASSITFKYKNGRGEEVTETINSSDFVALFGQGGYYALEENAIEIEVPGARADQLGFSSFLRRLGLRRLFKLARPPWSLKPRVDLAQYLKQPGGEVAITHAEIPDFLTGTRGWVANPMQILERTLHITPAFTGFGFALRGTGPSSLKFGRVAPSAHITGVSGSGPYELTVSANRYTQPDAPDGLPRSDAEAFEVGQQVRIINRDGSSAHAAFTTIMAIGTNTITTSLNFGGTVAAGHILIFADSDDVDPALQSDLFVFFADETDLDIGTLGDPAWSYADI